MAKVARNEYGRTEYQELQKATRRNAARIPTDELVHALVIRGYYFDRTDVYRNAIRRASVDVVIEHIACERCGCKGEPVTRNSETRSRTIHVDHIVPIGGAYRGAADDLPKGEKVAASNVLFLCYRCNAEKGRLFDEQLNQLLRALRRNRVSVVARRREIERHVRNVYGWLNSTQ